MVLVVLLFLVIFAFIAVSPGQLLQTLLAGAWILTALLAAGSILRALIQQL